MLQYTVTKQSTKTIHYSLFFIHSHSKQERQLSNRKTYAIVQTVYSLCSFIHIFNWIYSSYTIRSLFAVYVPTPASTCFHILPHNIRESRTPGWRHRWPSGSRCRTRTQGQCHQRPGNPPCPKCLRLIGSTIQCQASTRRSTASERYVWRHEHRITRFYAAYEKQLFNLLGQTM